MKNNYYDILEINKNASPEIIEKTYKTLVKKYHPDLQENSLKNDYEEKLKEINEAYDVLSNPDKRKNYDAYLDLSNNQYINKNINFENEINYVKNNYSQNAINQRIQEFKTNPEKIKKDLLALILTLIVLIIVGTILWQIPSIRNSSTFQYITKFIINIFK